MINSRKRILAVVEKKFNGNEDEKEGKNARLSAAEIGPKTLPLWLNGVHLIF